VHYSELGETLYHGSDTTVSVIDLSRSAPNKDFGKGFYCTTDIIQAVKFARIKAKRAGEGIGYVSSFTYNENPDIQVKKFLESDSEWFDFVLCNRGYASLADKVPSAKYDIIIGPVANDAVGLVLNQYIAGTYGSPSDSVSKKTAIRLLLTQKLSNQVFFGTERAVSCLRFVEISDVRIE